MASKVPNVTLNNAKKMPILGLGTWGSPKGEVRAAIEYAIETGYRHFDCAHVYENEDEVGEAIAKKIKEGVIKREDIFVTDKLWNTFHRPALVRPTCERTLKELGLDYVDMYLMHWPMAFREGYGLSAKDENGKELHSDVDFLDTWKAMEELVDAGLCKSIGISNFNKRQIEKLLENCRIQPATNQIECHPYLNQTKLMAFCKSKNIAITAYSPLGSPNRPWAAPGEPVLLEDEKILNMAKKYNKTAGQILIRYQIERGNIVIPKSATPARIESNFAVFDFKLTKDDIAVIDSFNNNQRFCTKTRSHGHPEHPFENDEY